MRFPLARQRNFRPFQLRSDPAGLVLCLRDLGAQRRAIRIETRVGGLEFDLRLVFQALGELGGARRRRQHHENAVGRMGALQHSRQCSRTRSH